MEGEGAEGWQRVGEVYSDGDCGGSKVHGDTAQGGGVFDRWVLKKFVKIEGLQGCMAEEKASV